jgi:hypothetical protein
MWTLVTVNRTFGINHTTAFLLCLVGTWIILLFETLNSTNSTTVKVVHIALVNSLLAFVWPLFWLYWLVTHGN